MRVWVATVVRLVLAAVWAWVAVARIADPAGVGRRGPGVPAAAGRARAGDRIRPAVRGAGPGRAAADRAGRPGRAAVSAVLFLLQFVGLVAAAARGLRIACGCSAGAAVTCRPAGPTAYPRRIAAGRRAALLAAGLACGRDSGSRWTTGCAPSGASRASRRCRPGRRRTPEARRRQAELAEAAGGGRGAPGRVRRRAGRRGPRSRSPRPGSACRRHGRRTVRRRRRSASPTASSSGARVDG